MSIFAILFMFKMTGLINLDILIGKRDLYDMALIVWALFGFVGIIGYEVVKGT